jgi:hypothetical protein
MTDNKTPIQEPLNFSGVDDTIPTAVIYCIQDLSHYNVEIRHNGNSHFIKKGGHPVIYTSKLAAKKAALANHAVKGFMALSMTYQEVGNSNKNPLYEYMPIDLHN